jgi:hypothetical protein
MMALRLVTRLPACRTCAPALRSGARAAAAAAAAPTDATPRRLPRPPPPAECAPSSAAALGADWRPALARSASAPPPEQEPREGATEDGAAEPELRWPLAIALAEASFEAYADLEERGLAERTLGGTEITYTSADFLRRRFAGLLRVELVGGAALPPGLKRLRAEARLGDARVGSGEAESGPAGEVVWRLPAAAESGADADAEAPSDGAEGKEAGGGGEAPGGHGFLFLRDAARQRLVVRVVDASGACLGIGSASLASLVADGADCDLEVLLRPAAAPTPAAVAAPPPAPACVRARLQLLPFSAALAEAAAGAPPGRVLGAPGSGLMPAEWRRLRAAAAGPDAPPLERIAFVEHAATDTQAWVLASLEARLVVVAFRGTEQGSWRDLLTDLAFAPTPLEPARVAAAPRRAALAALCGPEGGVARALRHVDAARKEVEAVRAAEETCADAGEPSAEEGAASEAEASEKEEVGSGLKSTAAAALSRAVDAVVSTASEIASVAARVRAAMDAAERDGVDAAGAAGAADHCWAHGGFLDAWDGVRAEILGLVDAAIPRAEERAAAGGGAAPGLWRVALTGHSLGGGLATLAALDLALRPWAAARRPELTLVNFGSPRVGNRAFARALDEHVPDAWRFVNGDDAVVSLPRLVGFCHCGHLVRLAAGAEPELVRRSSEAPLEGVALTDAAAPALPAVGARVVGAVAAAGAAIVERAGLEAAKAAEEDEARREASSEGEGKEGAAAVAELHEARLGQLWEAEKAAWGALWSGEGLAHHMEDDYARALAEAIGAGVPPGGGKEEERGDAPAQKKTADC